MPCAVRQFNDQLVETACDFTALIYERRCETISLVILVTGYHRHMDVRRLFAARLSLRSNGAPFGSVSVEHSKLHFGATPRPATSPYFIKIVASVSAGKVELR